MAGAVFLAPLAGLTKLKQLVLHDCQLGDLAPLANLPLTLCDLTRSGPLPDQLPVPPDCAIVR